MAFGSFVKISFSFGNYPEYVKGRDHFKPRVCLWLKFILSQIYPLGLRGDINLTVALSSEARNSSWPAAGLQLPSQWQAGVQKRPRGEKGRKRPPRLPFPWVKYVRAGVCVCVCSLNCIWLYPKGCSPPGSSDRGIPHARLLEWVSTPSSKESSWPRCVSCISCIGRHVLCTQPGSPAFKCNFFNQLIGSSSFLLDAVSLNITVGTACLLFVRLISVQFGLSVMSDSLWPHGL